MSLTLGYLHVHVVEYRPAPDFDLELLYHQHLITSFGTYAVSGGPAVFYQDASLVSPGRSILVTARGLTLL
jgi:hypothetical protein